MHHMDAIAVDGTVFRNVHTGARPGVTVCQVCGRLVIRGRGRWWEWTASEQRLTLAIEKLYADFRLRTPPRDEL